MSNVFVFFLLTWNGGVADAHSFQHKLTAAQCTELVLDYEDYDDRDPNTVAVCGDDKVDY